MGSADIIKIGISKKLTQINEISESEDTVLHELAHALISEGHGHVLYEKMCVKVGANLRGVIKRKIMVARLNH